MKTVKAFIHHALTPSDELTQSELNEQESDFDYFVPHHQATWENHTFTPAQLKHLAANIAAMPSENDAEDLTNPTGYLHYTNPRTGTDYWLISNEWESAPGHHAMVCHQTGDLEIVWLDDFTFTNLHLDIDFTPRTQTQIIAALHDIGQTLIPFPSGKHTNRIADILAKRQLLKRQA